MDTNQFKTLYPVYICCKTMLDIISRVCENDDRDAMNYLLKTYTNYKLEYVLYRCIVNTKFELAKLVFERKNSDDIVKDFSANNLTQLLSGCIWKNLEMTQWLYNLFYNKIPIDKTAILNSAIDHNDVLAARWVVSQYADASSCVIYNDRKFIDSIIKHANLELLQFINELQPRYIPTNITSFIYVVFEYGHINIIKYLIENYSDFILVNNKFGSIFQLKYGPLEQPFKNYYIGFLEYITDFIDGDNLILFINLCYKYEMYDLVCNTIRSQNICQVLNLNSDYQTRFANDVERINTAHVKSARKLKN